MIYTAGPHIGAKAAQAFAQAIGIDVGILYAIGIAIISIAITTAIIRIDKSEKPGDNRTRHKK